MKTRINNKEQGFTLIEIIAVLVILGILAAVAVPKFMDMQVDARKKAVLGVKASMQSAGSLAYAKAALNGATNASATIKIDNQDVSLVYGYPADATNLALLMTADGFTADANGFYLDGAPNPAKCRVDYTAPVDANSQPGYTVRDDCN